MASETVREGGLTHEFNQEAARRAAEIFKGLEPIIEREVQEIEETRQRALSAVEELAIEFGPLGDRFDNPEFLKESVIELYSLMPAILYNLSQRQDGKPRSPLHAIRYVCDSGKLGDEAESHFIGALSIAAKATNQEFIGFISWFLGGEHVRVGPESDTLEVEAKYRSVRKREFERDSAAIRRTFGEG